MKYGSLIKKLEARVCGGHPDGVRQDDLAREAADAIVLLQTELTATRKVLEEERERCAKVALNACLVPPDGGSPTEDERLVCERAAELIRALPSPQVKP